MSIIIDENGYRLLSTANTVTPVTKVIVNVRMSPHIMQILTKAEFSQQALLAVTLAIRQDFTKIRLREPNCSMRTDRQTDRYDDPYTLL